MKMRSLMLALVFTVTGFWSMASPAFAAVEAGAISELVGFVEIVRQAPKPTGMQMMAQKTPPQKIRAKAGDTVLVGDTVKTSSKGTAKILMNDDSVVSISPRSRFKITGAVYNPQNKSRESSFFLFAGRVKALVSKFWSPENTFTIRSKTAVAGVRGTEFVFTIDDSGQSNIAVIEGVVEVHNPSDSKKRKVKVTAKQQTNVKKGRTPGKPAPVPPAKMDELKKDGEIGLDDLEESKEGGDDKLHAEELDKESRPKGLDGKEGNAGDGPPAPDTGEGSGPGDFIDPGDLIEIPDLDSIVDLPVQTKSGTTKTKIKIGF